MKTSKYILFVTATLMMGACQNNDYEIISPILEPVPAEQISGQLNGDDYVLTWPDLQGKSMQVQVRNENVLMQNETVNGTTFTHTNVDTNIPYTYVLKVTDGDHFSSGTICNYTRPGATKISGLSMAQTENSEGTYNALVTWDAPADAESISFNASSDNKNIAETLSPTTTQYIIPNVADGDEWKVSVVAKNSQGPSLTSASTLRIGKTAIGYLSVYPDIQDLMDNGDDDEICAWLWLHEEYPSAQYVYFGDIDSEAVLTPFRVLFWMRDLEYTGEELDALGMSVKEVVFTMPKVVEDATPYITEWYKEGGSLLLWSHATAFVGELGRLPKSMLMSNEADASIEIGKGGWNPDYWAMSVELFPGYNGKIDHSSHPIFKGLDAIEFNFDEDNVQDTNKRIYVKGPGWTENHNCLYHNIPGMLTGLGNQDLNCYSQSVDTYGIIPLGTWDSQWKWISQLNVWEAQQGDTDFKGTIICVGNGGLDFSMRNGDGSPDLSAYPSNNPYQGTILTIAKNALEYLKGR